ncbi:MAG: diacylglycerol O-acyltransferase 1 [Claussenomyces sp. TS43310]|nr:MAG: diacylglycerol O-acyltransferase 1 [Claussenomyces sp. TS43310]
MAPSTSSIALNSEPADATSRKQQHLPPKSFADAVQAEPANAPTPSIERDNRQNGAGGTIGGAHGAKTLRIVNTHSENGSAAARSTDGVENKEQKTANPSSTQRHEPAQELSATGLDETPKSPPKHKHRNSASQKSKGSRSTSSQPTSQKLEDTSSTKINEESTLVFENFQDRKKSGGLASVKPAPDYEKERTQDRKEVRKDDDRGLVSGRQAGKNWERSGIRFAPWNLPLQRRLQTLVVLFHTLCIALSVSIFFFLCAIPIFWPLLIPYLLYCLLSREATSGGLRRRSNFLRSMRVWSLFASYFPARLHRSAELVPTRKYVFGYHPHGIISHGAFAAFGTEALGFSQLFPGITNTLLTLDSNFRIPLYRDYALAMGLASVSRESCENLLSRGGPNREGMGRAITIVVGGARESLDAKPHSMNLVLRRRYGFIKIALRQGADLVPVLAFGENDLYDQFLPNEHPRIHRMQLLLKKILGFTIPLFHARGVFNYDVGLMPYRRPLNIVVGRPIPVVQQAKPEQKELDRLHAAYMAELQRLWDHWKDDFAPDRKSEMAFVE